MSADLGCVSDEDAGARAHRRHLFLCTNTRNGSARSCGASGPSGLSSYLRRRVNKLRRRGHPGVFFSASGCLGRCACGPCLVIYPEGVWYRCADPKDAEEILQRHVAEGERVERLLIDPNGGDAGGGQVNGNGHGP